MLGTWTLWDGNNAVVTLHSVPGCQAEIIPALPCPLHSQRCRQEATSTSALKFESRCRDEAVIFTERINTGIRRAHAAILFRRTDLAQQKTNLSNRRHKQTPKYIQIFVLCTHTNTETHSHRQTQPDKHTSTHANPYTRTDEHTVASPPTVHVKGNTTNVHVNKPQTNRMSPHPRAAFLVTGLLLRNLIQATIIQKPFVLLYTHTMAI